MAETGYNWSAWGTAGTGVDGDSIATGSDGTSDLLDMDGKAACQVSILIGDPGTATTTPSTVYVQGDINATPAYETLTLSWAFSIQPTNGGTVAKVFSVDPAAYGKFRVVYSNDCGYATTVTIEYRTATIPPASA